MVENRAVVSSCDSNSPAASHMDSTSVNAMPYRLMEQFVIKVQKDREPVVWFYSVLFVN